MRLASICIALLIACLAFGASAQQRDWLGSHENDGPYLGLSAGWLHFTDRDVGGGVDLTYQEGFIVGVQGGYKLGVLRGEAELEYGRTGWDGFEVDGVEISDADADGNLFRWNVGLYYDFDNLTRLTPYFGGGLGGIYVEGDEATVNGVAVDLEDTLDFTAHGEAGLDVKLNDQVSLIPAYRFIWINSADGDFEDATAHVAKLGLRLRF